MTINPLVKTGRPLQVLALTICLAAMPLAGLLTGCTTTSRYVGDDGMSAQVKNALTDDPIYKYNDVKVVTYKGVVQLNGFVSLPEQKQRAGELASQVQGGSQVENNITIKE